MVSVLERVDCNCSRPAPFTETYSLDPYNLQLHCFLELGSLFGCSFFCPLDQPCKTLKMVQVTPITVSVSSKSKVVLLPPRLEISVFLSVLFSNTDMLQ